jgi:hypothetical protein
MVVSLLVVVCARSLPASNANSDVDRRIPGRVDGVEIEHLTGWFANIYPWPYIPTFSTVYPVRSLWTRPLDFQSAGDITRQNEVLEEYGSGADVLQYSPNPRYDDHNQWLRTYFTNGRRPFFVAYEHIFGTRLTPEDGAKDMDLPSNRVMFKADIDTIVRKVIVPYQDRYVSYRGRAVIYLWAAGAMYGNLASLLDELRAQYPVAFIGSVGLMSPPTDPETLRNLSALDGFMEYGLYAPTYADMITAYSEKSMSWRATIGDFEAATGRNYLFIPTFQAAFDDSKYPGRGTTPMYPRSRAEMIRHVTAIKSGMGTVYDPIGPFVVFSELFEGAAVIESQCVSDTVDKRDRYVGCGTGRLDVLNTFFGRN